MMNEKRIRQDYFVTLGVTLIKMEDVKKKSRGVVKQRWNSRG